MEIDTSIYGRVSIPVMPAALADLCAFQKENPRLRVQVRRGARKFLVPLMSLAIGECVDAAYDMRKLWRLAFG